MINIILVGVIIFQTIIHSFERKDLYNRIMCKDMDEYMNMGKKPMKILSGHERVLKRWKTKGGD